MNIRILLVALLISSATIAQETEGTESPETETQQQANGPGKNIGNIVIGPYFPIAFGDNFVNDGMDLKFGARLSFKVDTYKGIYIGPYFSFFNGHVTDRELLGNYSRTTNFTLGLVAGYEKHIDKFDISIGIGVGASSYSNDRQGDGFQDTATALWLNPEVSYRFSNYLGFYIAPEFRHDFMNIDVPAELKDTFNGVNYLNISVGLRINLGTAYKYL
ncbi:hypothetical protein POV26_07500 [Aequorivita todarodis]|uniref:hypothetical protein n=1 Tax=Aequorivita todarodis TaxID=2036821 RepID=UPI00234FDD4E|nr:hypothetical protein [Aequorivita todarodis]MDC8000877.1 hypothetical protein [Aequorivita todarodis]